MVNKKFCMAMLVIVLIFGMVVVGCDNGSTGGGATLQVINQYASPITRVVVGPEGYYFDQGGLNITSSQTFNISDLKGVDGAYTNIDLYASGLGGGLVSTIEWIGYGTTTTVTLKSTGIIDSDIE